MSETPLYTCGVGIWSLRQLILFSKRNEDKRLRDARCVWRSDVSSQM